MASPFHCSKCNMGFDWLGIELVPKYCKIIEKRIERHGKVRLDKFMPFISSEIEGKTQ